MRVSEIEQLGCHITALNTLLAPLAELPPKEVYRIFLNLRNINHILLSKQTDNINKA